MFGSGTCVLKSNFMMLGSGTYVLKFNFDCLESLSTDFWFGIWNIFGLAYILRFDFDSFGGATCI